MSPDEQIENPNHEIAYTALEDLFRTKKISGAHVAELRAAYGRMQIDLESRRTYEQKLVDRCRFLNEELDQQKTNLASIDEQDFPTPDQIKNSSEPVNEVLVLRQKLMKQMNNLEIYEEKNQELQYAIEAHTEHKRLLNLEKDRQPDPVQLEKQQDQLQQEIITDEKYLNLLKKQRIQTENEIKKIEQDIKEQHLCLEKAIEKQDFVTAEIVKNSTVDGMHPAELNRVIDKLGKLESQLQANNKRMDEEISVLKNELESKSQDSAVIQEQHDVLRKTLKEADMKNENKEREFGTLKADFNRDKYRETELLSKKEDLEIKSRLLDQEKASIHEQISRRKREYDRDSRNLKKKILQLNIMKDQLVDLNSQLTKTQAEVDNYPTDENESERKDLATEVENLKKKKLSEEAKATGEQEAWENLIETINKLSKEQEQERSVVNEQERILHMKSDEREMKAREVARAKARLKNILEDIQGADLESTDQKKRLKELNTSQDNFAKRYEQIKNEKNKYVNLIQSSSQKREELKAKLRIKKNEIEILQERLNDKEKELAKKTLKNQVAETQRDQKQAQINKAKNEKNILETELDTIKLECSKLTTMNTFLEDEMLKLRGIYESAVSFRNQRGVQLIEREEEVCVFYEKLNIQDSVIRKGDVNLEELNDEVEFLKIQVQEEQRQIDILKKHRPELSDLKTELVELQNELRRVQDKTVELEQKLETPELCSTRIRELGGEDLKPDKLESKLAQLELRLAQKEEQSLEKSLILEQVERLVHNIEGDQGRNIDDKRSLVEQCTEHKMQLENLNRKTLALISEISMEKAHNLDLQNKTKQLETTVQLANERLLKGEPPSDEMLEEWMKLIRDENRRREDKLEKHAKYVEMQKHILPNGGGITAAEPRPNAYLVDTVPDSNTSYGFSSSSQQTTRTIPVPKPYGSMAPFKPQQAGSSMRHIRKPKMKPLEL